MLVKLISHYFIFTLFLLCFLSIHTADGAKGKKKGGKKGVKNCLAFSGVKEYSRVTVPPERQDTGGPKIVKASNFQFNFKLGLKIWLVCVISGQPLPIVTWYKDCVEIVLKDSIWIEQKTLDYDQVYTKIEIDPTVLGDAGIYTCMASNNVTNISKNFKVEMV